jgi:hypothetical protein
MISIRHRTCGLVEQRVWNKLVIEISDRVDKQIWGRVRPEFRDLIRYQVYDQVKEDSHKKV